MEDCHCLSSNYLWLAQTFRTWYGSTNFAYSLRLSFFYLHLSVSQTQSPGMYKKSSSQSSCQTSIWFCSRTSCMVLSFFWTLIDCSLVGKNSVGESNSLAGLATSACPSISIFALFFVAEWEVPRFVIISWTSRVYHSSCCRASSSARNELPSPWLVRSPIPFAWGCYEVVPVFPMFQSRHNSAIN